MVDEIAVLFGGDVIGGVRVAQAGRQRPVNELFAVVFQAEADVGHAGSRPVGYAVDEGDAAVPVKAQVNIEVGLERAHAGSEGEIAVYAVIVVHVDGAGRGDEVFVNGLCVADAVFAVGKAQETEDIGKGELVERAHAHIGRMGVFRLQFRVALVDAERVSIVHNRLELLDRRCVDVGAVVQVEELGGTELPAGAEVGQQGGELAADFRFAEQQGTVEQALLVVGPDRSVEVFFGQAPVQAALVVAKGHLVLVGQVAVELWL